MGDLKDVNILMQYDITFVFVKIHFFPFLPAVASWQNKELMFLFIYFELYRIGETCFYSLVVSWNFPS